MQVALNQVQIFTLLVVAVEQELEAHLIQAQLKQEREVQELQLLLQDHLWQELVVVEVEQDLHNQELVVVEELEDQEVVDLEKVLAKVLQQELMVQPTLVVAVVEEE